MVTDSSRQDDVASMPKEPIHRLVGPLARFLHIEAASGFVLLGCTVVAFVLANSPLADAYHRFWELEIGVAVGRFTVRHSLDHWINDGLMAIFFFVVGLEVKRELVLGQLRDVRRAALPVAGALGGMIVPALIYLSLMWGQPGQQGWGVPMATDIAFVVGCMTILGPRVPDSLRVMLLTLAIVDDIGAILVIALGYSSGLDWTWLAVGLAAIGLVMAMARLGVRSIAVYILVGAFVWFAFENSGIHATIAGVILGLLTPAHRYVSTSRFSTMLRTADSVMHGDWETEPHRATKVRHFQWAMRETISPVEYLEDLLHPWVGFVIMPAFALANAGVAFELSSLGSPIAIGVMAGLVVGKPIGIVAMSWLAVKAGVARIADDLTWKALAAGGCLAGIGFTMALFIASLAFETAQLDMAKMGVLAASLVSASLGMALLVLVSPKPQSTTDEPPA